MVLDDEKGLETKRAYALNTPEGQEVQQLCISDLEPVCKIQEPTFFKFVRDSMESFGLYQPLVIVPMTVQEWKEEMEMDHHVIPPRQEGPETRMRIQAGCNRYFAMVDLGYTHCDCIVVTDMEEAQTLAHTLRCDKRWQRGSNLELLRGRK